MSANTRTAAATRPVFIPFKSAPWVEVVEVAVPSRYVNRDEMQAYLSTWQENACRDHALAPILECSSVSPEPIGKTLSAFNLRFKTPATGRTISVESAYQGSKVFKNGGPFHDIYDKDSRSAKTDRRTRESGQILGFDFFGRQFGLLPQNSFFNWLYLNTLVRNHPSILEYLGKHRNGHDWVGFTDVFRAFGMDRACQAEAVAMAVGLERSGNFTPDFISNHLIESLSEVSND